MAPLVAIVLPLVVAYGTTLRWCAERWNAPTQYFAHCWLLPFLAGWLLWQRRAEWRMVPRRRDLAGLWLLVPGLVLHLGGAALMVDSWSAASLVLSVPGACWFVVGRERLRGLWPVVWLVLFAVPMPLYVEGRLAFLLKEIAVEGGLWVGNLLGAGMVRVGDHLQLPAGGSLYVADACGGLRSLLAMTTLGYCLAFFTGPPRWWRRTALLLAVAPLAVAANVTRIGGLCLMARHFGVEFAEQTGHTLANVLEWLALLATLFGVDALLRRVVGAGAPPAPRGDVAAPASPERAGVSLWGAGVVLWIVGVPLAVLSWYRPFADGELRASRLPAQLGAFHHVARSAADERLFQQNLPRYCELLGTDDFVWRAYRAASGGWVHVVALFHESNWKSVHPPRICIEGSDMVIERDELVAAGPLADGVELGRIVARRRSDGARFVTLSVFGTAAWASGDYLQFVWHHLPLALFRRNQSGFLLRVESRIGTQEDEQVAERRCREFLAEVLPAVRQLLPSPP